MSVQLTDMDIGAVVSLRGNEAKFCAINWDLASQNSDKTCLSATVEMVAFSHAGSDFRVKNVFVSPGYVEIELVATTDENEVFNINFEELAAFNLV